MKTIRPFKPYVSFKSILNVFEVLTSGQLAEGPFVKRFEQAFGEHFNIDPLRCVALNSGTSALELAYEMAGVGPGDEVICPVMTMVASNFPAIHRGAKVVFADITDGFMMNPDDVEKRITKKTKAVVYVDFGGASRTLDEIVKICKKHNLVLIQDSAQSMGPYFRPRGDFVCVSFQAIKTLTCGDGGMLIPKTVEQSILARQLRWFGIDRKMKQTQGDCDIYAAGYKYHMNDISAAIGLGNLENLNWAIRRRAAVAKVYYKSGLPLLVYPWLVIFRHPIAGKLGEYLKKQGIETGKHHFRNDKYTVFGGLRKDLPMMDRLENDYICLPFHQGMSVKDASRVVIAIFDFIIYNT